MSGPRVVVDGVFFQLARTGIARLWESLLAVWARDGFPGELTVLDRAGTAPRLSGLRYHSVDPLDALFSPSDQRKLEGVCSALSAEVFVSTYYTTPLTIPSVQMVYDMTPEVLGFDLNHPEWVAKHQAINYASAYVAISENTARDLVAYFPSIDLTDVAVAPCAVSDVFRPASEAQIARLKARYSLSDHYFIYIGGRDHYKNARLMFEALSLRRTRCAEWSVLCVGGAPELEPDLRDLAGSAVVRVVSLGDAELPVAYSGAQALVFPSRYEGFGLPILEAMACGCPVITSPNASIPEVAGQAVIYVSDSDAEELAVAMESVESPGVRQDLRRRGFERYPRFSWTTSADVVQSAITDVWHRRGASRAD
jgi:glycosyltransferase involved in cell wall biosynthesis